MKRSAGAGIALALLLPSLAAAQSTLSLSDAVDAALASRPLLKAESERVAAAEAHARQAGAWPNPEVQFTNENLRPGQTYGTDVDSLAVVTQPLDVLGKRGARVEVAEAATARTVAEQEVTRRTIVQQVKLAYWTARGAQERRDLLRDAVTNFQRIVDYHTAQLSVGTIPEQDVLRVRLEHEQIQIAAHLATIEATAARAALFRQLGRPDDPAIVLSEPIDAQRAVTIAAADVALMQRADLQVSRSQIAEATANATLQRVNARPDVAAIAGYKRTLLPDAPTGVNTAIAGVRLTVPLFDRNTGNRQAAEAESRRQALLLTEVESQARTEIARATQEYELRRQEVTDTLTPLREHATSLAGIARAAYEQGAVDVLRLLDAERSRLEAERAWVDGMVAYQQSVVNLESAQGAAR